MPLALAKQATAHYLHATLEHFNAAAVREITRRFHNSAAATTAPPGSLELSYNEKDHIFALACHSRLGAELDETLGHVIRDYVASETPDAARFAECAFGDPFDDYEIELDEESATPPPAPKALITHILNFDGSNLYSKAKAFQLRDLPPALRAHTDSRHSTSHLANSVSLRRVRWDQSSEQHLFDGSIGQQLPRLIETEKHDLYYLIDLVAFDVFNRKINLAASRDDQAEAKHWEFVGEQPTIGQWLEGVGRARQVDPGAEPEIDTDAVKFASGQLIQQNFVGRLRKPKDVSLNELQPAQAKDEPEELDTTLDNRFAALLKPKTRGGSDTESSSSSSSSSSNADEASLTPSLVATSVANTVKDELATTPGKAPPPPPLKLTQAPALSDRTNIITTSSRHNTNTTNQSLTGPPTTRATSQSDASFPTFDRSYVKSDRWGLTGDAVKQATWEHENPDAYHANRRKRAPRTYEELQEDRAESASMSISVGRDRIPQAVPSVTPMSYGETVLGGSEPWANNIVAPQLSVPTGTLISTDGNVIMDAGRRNAPRFPPGLPPPGLSLGNFPPLGLRRCETVEEELLIRFDENETPLIERVQPPAKEQPRVHRTMRQQAGKHNKGRGGKHNSSNKQTASRPAVLEKPLPPPPPPTRQRKDEETTHLKNGPFKTSSRLDGDTPSEIPSPFQQAMQRLMPSAATNGNKTRLLVQFGMALLTDAEQMTASKAIRCADLQEQLDNLPTKHRATHFPRVLGRESVDGSYLLRLPNMLAGSASPHDGDTFLYNAWCDAGKYGIQDKRLYEINIVVPGGQQWTLTFEHDHLEGAEITPTDHNQQSIYVHYPQRVWDAHIRLESSQHSERQPELDRTLELDIKTFLKTLNTTNSGRDPKSPDYIDIDFEAIVPNAAFGVTDVLAKRIFSQALGRGSWIVTQVRDLHVHSARNPLAVFAKHDRVLQKEGRLWWEAALQHDGQDDLEGVMNEIIEKLDCVGFDRATAEAAKKPKMDKKPKQDQYIAFW